MMNSSPHQDDLTRPMPTRLLTSLKRPFSRPKNDHDRYPSVPPERAPIHREAPPNYQQIAMGLHLSRTPHLPAHLAQLYPPAPARLQRSVSSPGSSTSPRLRPRPNSYSYSHSHSHSHCPRPSSSRSPRSHSHSPARSPSRLAPPPARSALKKTMTTSSSVTPDTASASTVASSVAPSTPTRSSGAGLLARFLGKERGGGAARTLVVLADNDEPVREPPERKAVRFGGLKEEDES